MKVNGKKLLQKLKGEIKKSGPKTYYLNREVVKKFTEACEDIPPSHVVEELMREFIASKTKR